MTTYSETATDSLAATAGTADLFAGFYGVITDSGVLSTLLLPTDGITLTDSIAFAEVLAEVYIQFIEVTDAANFADVASPGVLYSLSVAESISLSDSVAELHLLLPTVIDALNLTEAQASQLTAATELLEQIVFREGTSRTGAQYVGWVANADTFAVSRYENWGVQSGGLFKGTYVGVGPDGVYELEGENDDGTDIDAFITLPKTDFGTSEKKGVQYMYAGMKADGGMQVRVMTDDGQEYVYELDAASAEEFRNTRAKFGKGLKSRYYEFDILNEAGADFELDTIEVNPLAVKRRL